MTHGPHSDAADLRAAIDAAARFHAHLRARVPAIDAALHAAGAGKPLVAPWDHFRRELMEHLDDEEHNLFPALLAIVDGRDPGAGDFVAPLQAMAFELDGIRTIADALRAAAPMAGPIEPELLTLLDALEEHAQLEEERLHPLAVRILADWERRDDAGADASPPPVEAPAPAPSPSLRAPTGRVLRQTRGRCQVCLEDAPAYVVRDDHEVRLEKSCPTHGLTSQVLSRSPDYWEEVDKFYFEVNSESYPQRDYIVRMTERCNLACPICLAKANTEDTPDLDLSGLEALLSERRGIKVDLMAAEPTLREDLEGWIRKVKATGNIAALHTNGLKLANLKYAQTLKDAGVDEVFLQFDGFDEDANRRLRGRPLVKARMAALANLRKLDIATSLIVVIGRGLNEGEVGRTYRFALEPENDHIREVFFLGLRLLGSARDSLTLASDDAAPAEKRADDMAMMPDEIIDLLCSQEPALKRSDVRRFNKLYFALLSAFKVKKCLYVQHYMVARGPDGTGVPVSDLLDLEQLDRAAETYARRFKRHPQLARAGLMAALARAGMNRETARMIGDLVRLQNLFRTGMNLQQVPRRFLLLGFITACDPHNFDADVAINCGKGELSSDGGFIESGAVANVLRESRFEESAKRPGGAWTRPADA